MPVTVQTKVARGQADPGWSEVVIGLKNRLGDPDRHLAGVSYGIVELAPAEAILVGQFDDRSVMCVAPADQYVTDPPASDHLADLLHHRRSWAAAQVQRYDGEPGQTRSDHQCLCAQPVENAPRELIMARSITPHRHRFRGRDVAYSETHAEARRRFDRTIRFGSRLATRGRHASGRSVAEHADQYNTDNAGERCLAGHDLQGESKLHDRPFSGTMRLTFDAETRPGLDCPLLAPRLLDSR